MSENCPNYKHAIINEVDKYIDEKLKECCNYLWLLCDWYYVDYI